MGESIGYVSDESPAQQPETPAHQSAVPARLTFRLTRISLLAVFVVLLGVTPIAWVAPWLLVMYLIPLVLLIWLLRIRTVVDTEMLSTRSLTGSARFRWDEVRSFRLDEKKWLRAVLTSGKEVRLPAVRVRDLPRLSALSGGRLSDPATTATPDQSAEAPADDAGQSDSADQHDESQ